MTTSTPRKLFSPNKSPSGVQSNPRIVPRCLPFSAEENEELWIDLENRLLSIGHRSQCGISREKSRPFSVKILQYVAATWMRSEISSINYIMSMTSFWRLWRRQCRWRGKFWKPGIQNLISRNALILKWPSHFEKYEEVFNCSTPMQRALDRLESKKLEVKGKQQQNQEHWSTKHKQRIRHCQ
jgi:hypothetical protein